MKVLDSFSLKGRVAVVSGGAGLFGRQIVEALAEAGAKTFMASRDAAKSEEEAKKCRAAGLDVTALSLDQGSEESVKNLLKEVTQRAGAAVDVLVNNAVLRPMKDWSDPAASFAKSMEVNATGIFVMTRVFGDHMAQRAPGPAPASGGAPAPGTGSIINVSSIQGTVGPDFTLYEGTSMTAPPDYFFHKAGMINFTRYAASKLGLRGVRVNAISPGGFFFHQPEAFLNRYNARTFLGRMANEEDLKGVIVFLASDASAYITGTNIMIDGGYTAK